ncbi:MAG: terpene cyclase/mutase family protein, partial [Planctomycetes bacterium]|nr:terpene cyclase/mutase family protein [Planctomycetota bacterium]
GTKSLTLDLRFAEPVTLDSLRLVSTSEGGAGTPKSFRFQVLKGRRWKTLAEAKDSFSPRSVLRFKATEAAEWRLEVLDVINDRWGVRIDELELRQLEAAPWPAVAEPTPDQRTINTAIERGMKWLQDARGADGNWATGDTKEFPMGVLALGGLALRKSGMDRDDPLVLDIVERLAGMELTKVYSVSLQAMFLRAVSRERYVDRLRECAEWLIDKQAGDGLWGYPDGRPDLSNAQYALLALKAAAEVGIEIPDKVYQRVIDGLVRDQTKDGGYGYVPARKGAKADPLTGSMTAAALACLDIATKALPRDRARQQKSEAVIKDAMTWLDAHYAVELNPGSHQSHYYWLYGLERVGAFFDRKQVGDRPWYRDGADGLIRWQWRNGSWHDDFADTCFALLFLRRASVTGD